MNSNSNLKFAYGKEEILKQVETFLPENSVRQYIIAEINNLCDICFKYNTIVHYNSNLNDFFKSIFELEHLGYKDKSVVSSYTEKIEDDTTSIIVVKLISGKDNNNLCIYYNSNSEITLSQLLELYGEYVCAELFPKRSKKED